MQMDRVTAEVRAEERRLQIEKANKVLWDQTDGVKAVHSKILLCDVIKENELLIEQKKMVQGLRNAQELAFVEQQRQALEVSDARATSSVQRRRSSLTTLIASLGAGHVQAQDERVLAPGHMQLVLVPLYPSGCHCRCAGHRRLYTVQLPGYRSIVVLALIECCSTNTICWMREQPLQIVQVVGMWASVLQPGMSCYWRCQPLRADTMSVAVCCRLQMRRS
jgi:hypothetical protein